MFLKVTENTFNIFACYMLTFQSKNIHFSHCIYFSYAFEDLVFWGGTSIPKYRGTLLIVVGVVIVSKIIKWILGIMSPSKFFSLLLDRNSACAKSEIWFYLIFKSLSWKPVLKNCVPLFSTEWLVIWTFKYS